MDEHPDFAAELKVLANEIHAGKLQDNSNMVQNVIGNDNRNVQAKAEQGGKQFIAEKMLLWGDRGGLTGVGGRGTAKEKYPTQLIPQRRDRFYWARR